MFAWPSKMRTAKIDAVLVRPLSDIIPTNARLLCTCISSASCSARTNYPKSRRCNKSSRLILKRIKIRMRTSTTLSCPTLGWETTLSNLLATSSSNWANSKQSSLCYHPWYDHSSKSLFIIYLIHKRVYYCLPFLGEGSEFSGSIPNILLWKQ